MTTETVLPHIGTEFEARKALARVPIEQPPGLIGKLLAVMGRRFYGTAQLDNGFAMAHQRKILFSYLRFEQKVATWKALDRNLKVLAEITVAAEIGCSWCVDFGYYVAHGAGLDLAKLQHVNDPSHPIYTPVERQVIEYATAATATPTAVTDALVADLRAALGDAALVELTMMIGVENLRSRFNAGLGLVAQGFSASCQLPTRE